MLFIRDPVWFVRWMTHARVLLSTMALMAHPNTVHRFFLIYSKFAWSNNKQNTKAPLLNIWLSNWVLIMYHDITYLLSSVADQGSYHLGHIYQHTFNSAFNTHLILSGFQHVRTTPQSHAVPDDKVHGANQHIVIWGRALSGGYGWLVYCFSNIFSIYFQTYFLYIIMQCPAPFSLHTDNIILHLQRWK